MMRVICGIITYNPSIEELRENVTAVKGQVKRVVIVDNASANISEISGLFVADQQVSIIRNKKNYGVAVGLNQIMKYSLKFTEIAESLLQRC